MNNLLFFSQLLLTPFFNSNKPLIKAYSKLFGIGLNAILSTLVHRYDLILALITSASPNLNILIIKSSWLISQICKLKGEVITVAEQWKQEGMQQGEINKALTIARNMLKRGIPDKEIIEITSIDQKP